MRITFLGGATAIGASSAMVEVDDSRWIVDCGVRMKGSGAERLPDLSPLEDGGAPSAILLTHAHLDHLGALPLLHLRYPFAPVYATAPTIALARVQFLDSLRIMEEEARVDGEVPLFSKEAVEGLLAKMVPVTPLRPLRPDPNGPEVTFFPAGHILGAASLGIAGREGSLFLSGDISVDNQRSIPGMRPPRFRADVAVFESTYGKRLHPARAAEEDRLVATVAAAIEEGGRVLVPAFAIGRAQEVILILMRAQLQKRIPPFPIHVDGMVRSVCSVYSRFPAFLQSTLRRRIEKHGDPFFDVLDHVRPVRTREERQSIPSGPPCAIVSSSGMLSGGPSPVYARALLDDPRNLIAITGYQDEEAPGRRLLEYSREERETFPLEGQEVRPRCRVASYGLSGHASGLQIAALARALRPADVFLVHGDTSARHDLADLLLRERLGRVHLPAEAEPIAPPPRRGASGSAAAAALRRLRVTGIGRTGGRAAGEPEPVDLPRLSDHVLETYREGTPLSAEELHRIWHGAAPADEAAAERFEESLRASERFSVHPRRLFEFVAVEPTAPEEVETDPAREFPRVAERIDAALPQDARLLRKSYQPGVPHLVLVFAFPDVAERRLRPIIEEVLAGSGWTWEVHPQPNLSALDSVMEQLAPDPGLLARRPSVHIDDRRVTLHLSRALAPGEEAAWDEAIESLREMTGFEAEVVVKASTPAPKVARDAEGRLEVNLAYRTLRSAFAGETHSPRKIGKKADPGGVGACIELAFISPEVGERYRSKLDELERETGWPLRVSPRPDQNAIVAAARSLLGDLVIRKGPSFRPAERSVSVRLEVPPPPDAWERLRREFESATGYRLDALA